MKEKKQVTNSDQIMKIIIYSEHYNHQQELNFDKYSEEDDESSDDENSRE